MWTWKQCSLETVVAMTALFSLLGSTCVDGQNVPAVQCFLSAPIALEDDLALQHVKNDRHGTYTMKWTYTGGYAWIGIGINREGRDKMTPADAVIGRMNDDGMTTSVLHYGLSSDAEDASGVEPYPSNTIQDATFEQFESEDGTMTTVLTFTQDLEEMAVTDDSIWIYAVGLPDNVWVGKHDIHGSFQLPLVDDCIVVTPSPTIMPTTASPTTVRPPTISPLPTMTPIPTSMPTMETGSPTSSPSTEAQSIESEASLAASTNNGLIIVDTTRPDQALWIAHGITLAIAWGVCAPLGIGASILRDAVRDYLGQSWYKLHFYLNLMTILLTIVGFVLAVVAIQREGEEHFHHGVHQKAGLVILILVVLQGLAGYLRPPATLSSSKSSTPCDQPSSKHDKDKNCENEDEEKQPPCTEQDSSNEIVATQPQPPISILRICWEWSHRLMGTILLGLAWYNCHTGIILQLEYWPESKDWIGVFWGITVGVAGSIFVLAYVIKVQ